MKGKKTVFVLGAGASCPYGYPSGARLRERIVMGGFSSSYGEYSRTTNQHYLTLQEISEFTNVFKKSGIKSIDMFMANNPKFAKTGKYIAAFEILRAEQQSLFREEAKHTKEWLVSQQFRPADLLNQPLFHGEDWYSYLYNRIIEGMVGKGALPDFSNGNLTFITFNYDRSLEQFLYESLRNSYTEAPEEKIVEVLKQLRIIHVYGQIAPLKWQNKKYGVDYKPQITESVLQNAAKNIKTIYEEKESPELEEAKGLLKQADRIFFLGFGYAPENMDVLGLPNIMRPDCRVYGTAFDSEGAEIERFKEQVKHKNSILNKAKIEKMDCLKLLRNYFLY